MAFYRSPAKPSRATQVPELPAASPAGIRPRLGWVIAGVVLPVVTSLALVPVREEIDRSTAALVLVLPVVVVAHRGGRVPAALAAVVTPLAFDVLLTRPYHRFEMAVAADLEAAVILLVVGSTVAVLVSRSTQAHEVASARGRELRAFELAAGIPDRDATPESMAKDACSALRALLDLRTCRWAPGYRGSAYPVLGTDGEIVGASTADRAPLPAAGVELPVRADGRELGRFILVPGSGRPVSREERLVAVTVAELFGRAHGLR